MQAVIRTVAGALILLAMLQDAAAQNGQRDAQPSAKENPAQRYAKLEKLLTGSKLVGQFTILGKQQDFLAKEEYTILSAKKMDKEDWWLLKTRIKYGDKDLTTPIALRIKWADDTPVITLTNLPIPTLGTFTSRVVIYNGKYAGTWTHGEVGGHLFGVIERASQTDDPSKDNPSKDDAAKDAE